MNITNENYTIKMKDISNKAKQIVQNAIDNPHIEEHIGSDCCNAEPSQLNESLCSECLEHAEFN